MDAEKGSTETNKHSVHIAAQERIVVRPNLAWYLAYSALPIPIALGIYLALATRDIQLTVTAVAFAGVVVAIFEVFAIVHLLGLSIEVDDENMSKVYFFGLLRRQIPREHLRASSHVERGSDWSHTRVDFERADGEGSGFSAYPFWVSRAADVDLLSTIAAEGKGWRVADHLELVEQERVDTIWIYVLFGAASLALVVGLWSATESHSWTPLWPLDVAGGLMSYVPLVVWIAYGKRLPRRPLMLWPARAVALIATFAIPQLIWSPVPGPSS